MYVFISQTEFQSVVQFWGDLVENTSVAEINYELYMCVS